MSRTSQDDVAALISITFGHLPGMKIPRHCRSLTLVFCLGFT
jgi:hypothetical protein